MTAERIQKVLANEGIGSRRQIEQWIENDLITVNSKPAFIGQKITSDDTVVVDGKRVMFSTEPDEKKILAYHKPIGEITSRSDPQGRPCVFEKLPALASGRWIAVGRLDINTCGLLLFTNDGELANRLMHPSNEVQREYAVRVLGEVTPQTLLQLTKGIKLEDGFAKFHRIKEGGGEGANKWFRVVLTEGRQREVRRLWEAVDCKVSRLIRVRFGNIHLEKSLRPGASQLLGEGEKADLYKLAGMISTRKSKPIRRSGTLKARRPASDGKDGTPRRKKKRGGLYRR